MDIIATTTGRTFRRVDECIAQLLMDAFPESFKRVKNPAAAPVQTGPRFWVAPSATTGNIGIHVQLPSSEVRSVYTFASKAAAEAALGAGPMPQALWDSYQRQTNHGKDPEWLGDQAARQVAGNKW